jgi:hypothetical protein
MNRIDLIIDALESAYEDKAGWCDKVNEALYAARSLRALKPVAWINISGYYYAQIPQGADPSYYTPLYALEVTK